MFKFAGLMGLVLGTGLIGIMKSFQLKERIRLLEDYLQMILDVKGYINYFREPLIQIYRNEGKKCGSEGFELFDRVRHDLTEKEAEISQIWAQNVDKIYASTCLGPEDIELLKYPGFFIGQTDYENQLARFEYLEKRLVEQIEAARENYVKTGPLYRKLGFFAGGLAAIFFI